MLFRNTKTGNILSVLDELTKQLMDRSPIYERVEKPAPAKAAKPAKALKAEKEPAKKPTRKKAADKAE